MSSFGLAELVRTTRPPSGHPDHPPRIDPAWRSQGRRADHLVQTELCWAASGECGLGAVSCATGREAAGSVPLRLGRTCPVPGRIDRGLPPAQFVSTASIGGSWDAAPVSAAASNHACAGRRASWGPRRHELVSTGQLMAGFFRALPQSRLGGFTDRPKWWRGERQAPGPGPAGGRPWPEARSRGVSEPRYPGTCAGRRPAWLDLPISSDPAPPRRPVESASVGIPVAVLDASGRGFDWQVPGCRRPRHRASPRPCKGLRTNSSGAEPRGTHVLESALTPDRSSGRSRVLHRRSRIPAERRHRSRQGAGAPADDLPSYSTPAGACSRAAGSPGSCSSG